LHRYQVDAHWPRSLPHHAIESTTRINGIDGEICIVRRDTSQRVASDYRLGRITGEFYGLPDLAADSRSNLFTAQVRSAKRVQRLVPQQTPLRTQ
jgi:hypothetical protein